MYYMLKWERLTDVNPYLTSDKIAITKAVIYHIFYVCTNFRETYAYIFILLIIL